MLDSILHAVWSDEAVACTHYRPWHTTCNPRTKPLQFTENNSQKTTTVILFVTNVTTTERSIACLYLVSTEPIWCYRILPGGDYGLKWVHITIFLFHTRYDMHTVTTDHSAAHAVRHLIHNRLYRWPRTIDMKCSPLITDVHDLCTHSWQLSVHKNLQTQHQWALYKHSQPPTTSL